MEPETTMVIDLPSLDSVTQSLKYLTRDLSSLSVRRSSRVYSAAIGLLCLLRVDQRTLRESDNAEHPSECPSPDKIPAITAVLQDVQLFRCLLKCLQSSNEGDADRLVPAPALGRKRSLSVVSDQQQSSNKLHKASHHSPLPPSSASSRAKLVQSLQQQQAVDDGRPTFNISVLAATILYCAFSHVDHWPSPLIKAYADDCFGARTWVDDEGCMLLVENLRLAHAALVGPAEPGQLNSTWQVEARKVASAYIMFLTPSDSENDADVISIEEAANDGVHRRGSLSSIGSVSLNRRPSLNTATSETSTTEELGPINHENGLDMAIKSVTSGDCDSADSSSGDEDEEEVVLTSTNRTTPKRASSTTKENVEAHSIVNPQRYSLYPLPQTRLNLVRVRQRFFGENLDLAHALMSSSLSERLDARLKQNSGLLQSLTEFVSVPSVRELIATNLEKWLQSPALSGLARTLFSLTVTHVKEGEPPLDSDIRAIDSIIGMRLKPNQLNAHIENLTAIAKRIPYVSVVRRMYAALVPEAAHTSEPLDTNAGSDKLKMVVAIHRTVPSRISYDAMAMTLVSMLSHNKKETVGSTSRDERNLRMKQLRATIRSMATELSSTFDSCTLARAILSVDVNDARWSIFDEEDRARIMFLCIVMDGSLASSSSTYDAKIKSTVVNGSSRPSKEAIRSQLLSSRKIMLSWCCNDYGPHCAIKPGPRKDEESLGAGPPSYASVLGPSLREERVPPWLKTMRCLLFLEVADSLTMKQFLGLGAEDESEWVQLIPALKLCCQQGADLDDEMLWAVVNACNGADPELCLSPEVAIIMLENLFKGCNTDNGGTIEVKDCRIARELYDLAEYVPLEAVTAISAISNASEVQEDQPRVALPGLWWRVTMLVLIMSCKSPRAVGSVVWNENATVCALIKMIVSNRYRFPTVDCDETARESAKRGEQTARDTEFKIAERLFLPPIEESAEKETKKAGVRISKRLLKQQQEKMAAKTREETVRRKRLLKAAQKSIMLWNPDGPARKPPREVADLLLAVQEAFSLAHTFQRSVDPDFLLLTLGGTTRGAIERAYEWLIPVISQYPDTIARLPSSASCFLLLRAYGSDADERARLKALSAPLLDHVSGCLKGDLGKEDCVKAFDLLMADFASHKAERRRCARRVLHDSLQLPGVHKSWMIAILEVKYAEALVRDAINYMSLAATFERGGVLRSLIIALESCLKFAESKGIACEHRFGDLLIGLVSNRLSVFAETMSAFSDLRSLIVTTARAEYIRCAESSAKGDSVDVDDDMVRLRPRKIPGFDDEVVLLPMALLLSISVLLSIWEDSEQTESIDDLLNVLMRNDISEVEDLGLASATIESSSQPAVTVDSVGACSRDLIVQNIAPALSPASQWIMLGKARSDSIARRAALSAPIAHLPRLLMCSGLPRASLVTMIDRLGHIGDSAPTEKEALFQRLLVPCVSNEFDQGRIGRRRDVARKLLGRLAAYARLYEVSFEPSGSSISTTFLSWLSEECRNREVDTTFSEQKHRRPVKSLQSGSSAFDGGLTAASILSGLLLTGDDPAEMTESMIVVPMYRSNGKDSGEMLVTDGDENQLSLQVQLIEDCIKTGAVQRLESLFEHSSLDFVKPGSHSLDGTFMALQLIQSFMTLDHKDEGTTRLLFRWVPTLTESRGSPALCRTLFGQEFSASMNYYLDELVTRCSVTWSRDHVASVLDWFVTEPSAKTSSDSRISIKRFIRFLVSAMGAPSGHLDQLSSPTVLSKMGLLWSLPPSTTSSLISAAIRDVASLDLADLEAEISGRNRIMCSAFLLLAIASKDADSACAVVDLILEEIKPFAGQSESSRRLALEVVLLRLYLLHANWVNLATAPTRMALLEAAERFPREWVTWRASFDDQIENMLDSILSGEWRMTRPLAELSRSHPLLILRMIPDMICLLDRDATTGTGKTSGKVQGKNVDGALVAAVRGHDVRVLIRHWGFTYTEQLWFALLDVVASAPGDLLFNSGLKLGVLDFFTVYLNLLSVQLQLFSADRATRLQDKLRDCFTLFQRTNASAWRRWLDATLVETGRETRHVLMTCNFITPQEAIDSLKVREA